MSTRRTLAHMPNRYQQRCNFDTMPKSCIISVPLTLKIVEILSLLSVILIISAWSALFSMYHKMVISKNGEEIIKLVDILVNLNTAGE